MGEVRQPDDAQDCDRQGRHRQEGGKAERVVVPDSAEPSPDRTERITRNDDEHNAGDPEHRQQPEEAPLAQHRPNAEQRHGEDQPGYRPALRG